MRNDGSILGPESPSDDWASREVEAMLAAWDRGEQATAAEVISRHPGIEAESAIRLIFEETCLRRDVGQFVDTSEVVRAYPLWSGQLKSLFECDRLLRPVDLIGTYPAIGETLGPFLILAELGRGASGRTFLAKDPTLADRPVVVKVIADNQDEHLVLARLRHTHIVPLFSEHAFPEQGFRGLCMPYLGGASLARILQRLSRIPAHERTGERLVEVIDDTGSAPVPPHEDGPFRRRLEQTTYSEAVTAIGACLADALHYAHAHGLVHMDIKSSNVLISADGRPMLLDFHLARSPIQPGESVSGRFGGTPGWMSPEQVAVMDAVTLGNAAPFAVDGRTDIYALGRLLAEALAEPGEMIGREMPRLAGGVRLGLADIIRKCLAPEPEARYQDAAALAEDLRRELDDLPLRGVRNRSPIESLKKWRRRNPGPAAWVGSILIGSALALSAAGAYISHRMSQLHVALNDARRFRESGRYEEATTLLNRSLSELGRLPAVASLRTELIQESSLARRGWEARNLHLQADQIRFRLAGDATSHTAPRSLIRSLQRIRDRAKGLRIDRDGPRLDEELESRIKTDLLELVAIEFDVTLRLSRPETRDAVIREARNLLDEAERLCGSSPTIDRRRRRLVAAPHANDSVEGVSDSKSAWDHYDQGRSHLDSGRLEAAAIEFDRALELTPQDFWSQFYSGISAYRLRRFEEAVAAFRTCIALAPDQPICYFNRASALEALGRFREAERNYTLALKLDPEFTPGLLNRGILAYRNANYADAFFDFDRALKSSPDAETEGRIRYSLALTHYAVKDHRSARNEAESAVRLGSREAQVLLDALRQEESRTGVAP